ncbi:MAG: SCP2 sterol-binding domain-containing protein [Promethearchaeota archaeon]
MGLLFGTEEWLKVYVEKLNQNKKYEDAAKTWEGDFLFIIEPAGNLDHEIRFYVDLYHGKARDAYVLKEGEEKETAFVFSGPYTNYVKLIEKKLDPIQGLMQGKFKLKGDMGKVMRAVKAAQELVNTILMIDTELY